MNKIVSVRLGTYGKVYDLDSGHFVLQKGDQVVVNTEQGLSLGVVCAPPRDKNEKDGDKPLMAVHRMATRNDLERHEKNCRFEAEVYAFCYNKIRARSLSMNLISAERLFDCSKMVIYFSAEGRVDFRDLVKDLVQKFHSRIEMRQIGVRHQAKMVGGLGTCGRKLCCSSHLNDFEPVSIKMAKKQNLSLNPSKISGMCGRLMCCLAYEYEYYKNTAKNIPKVGKMVETKVGKGKVIRQNLLKQSLTVVLDSMEEKEISCDDILKVKKPENEKVKKKKDQG